MRCEPVDLIVSSPLQRAVTTAETIGSTMSTHPHRSGLKEVNVGELDACARLICRRPYRVTAFMVERWV